MKFLILSDAGDGMGIALRLQEEGNDVIFHVKRPEGESIGAGLLNCLDKSEVDSSFFDDKDDLIIMADCTGFGAIMDGYKKAGYHTLGGSSMMDRMENDRYFASALMKECGIKVPPSKSFTDWESGAEFVKKNESKRFVFKPSGSDSGNVPSFVSRDSESLVKMFEKYKAEIHGSIQYELQEFIPGIDISTEVWFSRGKPLYPANHTLETKHLMNDDLGPSGGCSGNVVWTTESTILTKNTIERMFKFCEKEEYTGPLDVNSIVSDSGIHGLEFTPRFGYDATPTIFWSLLEGELGKFLADAAKGQTEDEAYFSNKLYGSGVKLSISPWPFEEEDLTAGIPIDIKNEKTYKPKFYPYNIRLNKDKELETCGAYGMVGIATGSGSKINESMEDALNTAKHVLVPDVQYRTDLGEVFTKRFNKISRLLSGLN